MIHGLNNSYLYAAKKITAIWKDKTNSVTISGTGFFIQKGSDLFLITNRHVVEPGYFDEKYDNYEVVNLTIEHFEETDENNIPIHLKSSPIANWSNFKFHDNVHNDIACLKNPASNTTINTYIPYSMIANKDWINQNLSVCDTIAYPGFPQWYDRQNKTPIFRMGTIASDPRLNYSCDPTKPISEKIAYEGFSTSGASGSPVFAIQRGFPTGQGINAPKGFYREVKLIGINAGHFPDAIGHSGISYMYKSSAIVELIDSLS